MRSILYNALLGALLLLVPAVAQAQVGTVQGVVTERGTGITVPGVNVTLEGTTIGTATDLEGRYEFSAPVGTYTLVVSAIGYKRYTQPVTITESGTVTANAVIEQDVLGLDDVVVTGYGTTERRAVSTSISSVDGNEIRDLPPTSTDAVLQGRVAGVTVLRSSGTPGGGVSVRVRGATSISGSNQPLYVVDGVPVNSSSLSSLGAGNQGLNALSTIDPSDIASIEVLKDAAATAIYGTRAANGVVLVTTRRGQAGSTDIEFESSLGSASFDLDPNRLTGPEYIAIRNEARVNTYGPGSAARPSATYYGLPDTMRTNNAWDAITQTGLVQNYRLAISGGTQRTKYRVSGGYSDEEGALIKAGFRRLNGLVNVDHRWADKGTLFAKASYNRGISLRVGNDNYIYGVLTNGLLSNPAEPLYLANGQYNPAAGPFSNPVAEANKDFTATDTKFLGNVGITYELLPNLSGRLEAGLDRYDLDESRFSPSTSSQGSPNGARAQSINLFQNWILTGTVNYRNLFKGVHSISSLAGVSTERRDVKFNFLSGVDFFSDEIYALDIAGTLDAGSSTTASGLRSFFTTSEYAYNNKYLATFTLRVDQSSRFGADNRTAVFPAFSLGWNAQQEPFLQRVSWIDLFKIRGSYGTTGQQEIGDFNARALYASGSNYNLVPGLTTSQLGNVTLSWERTTQGNLGLDYGFLSNRIGGTIELYSKRTNDLLRSQPLPNSTGYGGRVANIGEISNKGIEFLLTTRNLETRNFSWETSFNIARNTNEVVELVDGDGDGIGDPIDQGFASRIAEGEPLGSFYGWVTDGLFQSQDQICLDATGVSCLANGTAFQKTGTALGDRRFQDIGSLDENGQFIPVPDGIVDDADRRFIGDANPDFFGGVTNTFRLYGVELSAFLQFSQGNDVLNSTAQFNQQIGQTFGTARQALDRWTPDNTDTDIPRATITDPNDNDRDSDYFVEDASYIRLKTLSVAYTIPVRYTQVVGIRNMRLFFVGENLWTSTKYSGLDPEVSTFDRSNSSFGTDFFTYPQAKRFTLGARVTL